MVYETLLDECVTRLTDPTVGLGGAVVVTKLPETEAAYSRAYISPQVWVGYNSSEFDGQESTAQVLQKETLALELSVISRKLYGSEGVYDLLRRIRINLLGFKFSGAERRTTIKEIAPHPGVDSFGQGTWRYRMIFNVTWPIVQFDDEDFLAPAVTMITVNNPTIP